MITLAGEGIELPIATDHNVHVNHKPYAIAAGVAEYFTPVIGNEVTTKQAHFNVFPVKPGAAVPDHRGDNWAHTFAEIDRVPDVKVVILNHARDIHSGVRPFGPKLFNAATGENLEGWNLRANAMEVANSSANQTDGMQLFKDWMTLLNRGHQITPVGSSDSHDVARHFVGQGRTYIRCDDRRPGDIDVDAAVNSFVQGRVMVSYGLLTSLTVNGKYGPGELARASNETITVQAQVQHPSWIKAGRVQLFANGEPIRELNFQSAGAQGTRHNVVWKIPTPKHDIHLVAIATGPGVEGFHWRTAKPYQPSYPVWEPTVIGASGAVWIDGDGNGKRNSAYDYANAIVGASASVSDRDNPTVRIRAARRARP